MYCNRAIIYCQVIPAKIRRTSSLFFLVYHPREPVFSMFFLQVSPQIGKMNNFQPASLPREKWYYSI